MVALVTHPNASHLVCFATWLSEKAGTSVKLDPERFAYVPLPR